MSAEHAHRSRTLPLIRRIEALLHGVHAPEPARLAEALSGPVSRSELSPFVNFSDDRYTRNLVARGEGWELRLLCWAPGQTSALHGHGRSACAFRVLSGEAEELRIGGGRRILHTGAIALAGEHDVHQVGNVGSAPLMTLHLYAPPLPVDQPSAPEGQRIVVLGGGFCGAALAIHLLEQGGPDLRITVVERSGELGRGVAYGTTDPGHLLNVPAVKMSLNPADPEAFLRFVRERGLPARPTDLLPRALYGEYVSATLAETVRQRPGRLRIAAADAVEVGDGEVRLSDGRRLPADQVVVATGHLPPRWPDGLPEAVRPDPRIVRDAWDRGALDRVGAAERVLVLGTGLTAVDVLLSLRARGHTATVFAVSRHGRWPEAHLPGVAWTGPAPSLDWPAPREARPLARWLNDAVERAEAQLIPWQAVIDAIRPQIPVIWAALPTEERAIFLARYRSRWEVLRHRAPAASLATLGHWEGTGQLQRISGELEAVRAGPDGLEVALRGGGEMRPLVVDRIVLCNGADTDVRRAENPALRSLLAGGRVRADPLGLGLEVDEIGRAVGVEGGAEPGVWVLGAARRPRLWETTAVPELARQAAALAGSLLERVGAHAGGTREIILL